MGKFEVTFAEWDACAADGGCASNKSPSDPGWGKGRRPVVNVSWNDAKEYAAWLSRKTGKTYRLLSEAEWEYAARAGTSTAYAWGNAVGRNHANCSGCGSQFDNMQTAPVGSFPGNAFGLHDMHGNVWEWVEDCWHGSYQGAPTDGSAWTTSCMEGDSRVIRGGAWGDDTRSLRVAVRTWYSSASRYGVTGFRLARTLD